MPDSRRTTIEQAFGQALKRRREQLGISQEDLALESDLHRTFISQIERGIKTPTLRSILSLAKALKTTATALVRETERSLKI